MPPEADPKVDPNAPAAPPADPPAGEGPKFTQEEVNRMVGSARTEARAAFLKKFGLDSEDALKLTIEEAEAIKADQLTEVERAQTEAKKAREEAETAKAEAATERLNNLRARIGHAAELPEPLIARMQGTDEESLKAEAEELAALVKPEEPGNVGGGTRPPSGGAGKTPNEQMADALVSEMTSRRK